MAIKTSSVSVFPLRGMDQRWLAKANRAELIEDMCWSNQDAWKQAGGYTRLIQDYNTAAIPDSELTNPENTVATFTIVSPATSKDIRPNVTSNPQLVISDVIQADPGRKVGVESHDTTSLTVSQVTDTALQSEKTNASSTPTSNAYVRHTIPYTLHWFAQFNGAFQWLLYETTDGSLKYFYGARAPYTPYRTVHHVDGRAINGTSHTRTHIDGEWTGSFFQTFGGRVYIVNGYDEPLCFDGRKTTRAGFANFPPQPTISKTGTIVTGTTEADETNLEFLGIGYTEKKSTYRYRVSFLNERGQESPMSSVFGEITVENSSGKRHLVHVQIPKGPKGTVARRIYRTQNLRDSDAKLRVKAFGDEFYFLKEVQDNITTIIVDGLLDIALGTLNSEENYGFWESSYNRIAAFKNCLFLANARESLIRFSSPRQPEELPIDNEIDLGDSNSGPIVAMYQTKNALVIFKRRGIYLIKGDPVNGFFAETLTLDTGCIASKSIKEIPGMGLAFLSSDGVFLLEGAFENTGTITAITRLGQPIEDEFKRMNLAMAENSRACLNTRDKEYWLCVPENGDIHPELLFKFHYEVGEWSLSRNFKVHDFVSTEDHRGYVMIASSETTSTARGLYVYSRAFTTKGSSTVAPLYRTVHLTPNRLFSSFDIVRVQAYVIGYGDNDLQVNFKVNRQITDAYTADIGRDQKRPLEDFSAPIYDTTNWDGSSTWYTHRPVPVRFDLSSMHKGPVQEIQFEFKPQGSRIQILGYDMEVRIGSRREVLTLTSAFGGTETR